MNKTMWLMMAAIVLAAVVLTYFFHLGALVLVFLICPIMMLVMMASMGGMGHGGDKH